MSFVPKRTALRRPSRPNALLPIARVRLALKLPVDTGGCKKKVDVGSTLPLCDTFAAANVMFPWIVIRTGGRKYPGVKLGPFPVLPAFASVRSQVSRNGSHK